MAARPRMASPRSIGSILITSAPQSARSAEAAGTNVCSATSRTRTPSITAVTASLPLPAPAGSPAPVRRNLNLTSTSTIASCLEGPPPGSAGPQPGGVTRSSTLPTARPSATWRRAATTSARSNSAPMSGRGPALGQQLQELAVVARHVGRLVRGEVAELEAEDVDALEQHQVEGYPWDGPGGVAHGHEAAAVVQRAQGGLGQVAAHRVDHDVGAAGQGLAQRLAQVAGAVVDQPLRRHRPWPPRASRATRRPPSPSRPARRRVAPRPSRRRRRRRAR